MTVDNPDRRTEPRKFVSWRSQVIEDTGRVTEARVVDVSRHGLGMLAEGPLPLGATVLVHALIPPREAGAKPLPFQVRMKVVFAVMSQGRFRIGGEFVQLDSATRKLLEPFL